MLYSGEHKRKILIHVAVDGIEIRDGQSGVSSRGFDSERFTTVCSPIKAKFRSRAFTCGSIRFLTLPYYYSIV